ncbi:MAG: Gldg family protein [Halofilum sp. (in: g-proteobacteria)]|nr:Gldg family protein [Halofilum sp. (in: g-proteobacteria)]
MARSPHSSRRLQSLLAILLAGVLFVALVLVAQTTLRGYRLDLTEDELYTVSAETREILREIDEPITLTFYFSRDASEGVPFVRQYAQRVRELLEEYVAYSDGMLELRTVDPKPLTEARDQAVEYGLEAVPASSGSDARIFMGLVGTNRVDGLEVIEFFDPERERFLEYDITRLVWSLQNPDKPVVGIMSRLPITQTYDPTSGRAREPWAIVDRLQQIAEVRRVETPTDRIDPTIDVLLVAHPHGHDDATLYALDQWLVHHGGRAVVLLDPVAEAAGERAGDDGEPSVSRSDAGPLPGAWGIDVTLEQALIDPRHGMVVSVGEEIGRTVHPGLIGIMGAGIDREDVVTANLERLLFGSPGSIRDLEGGLRVTPLVRTAESAGLIDAGRFAGLEHPGALAEGFRPGGTRHVVAARLDGPLRSAWPEGPPEGARPPAAGHRAASAGEAHMILLSDVDLLSDRLWVSEQSDGQRRIRQSWSDNGDLVANAVENLLGSDALIRIRGEGTSARPFTRVRALEREAAAQYRETEQALRRELERTEQRLQELRSGRGDAEGDVILSEAQRRELERFRQERSRLRGELRRVRQQLDAEIDALGDRLKLLNIVAVPLVVALAGLAIGLLRRRRRRRRMRP